MSLPLSGILHGITPEEAVATSETVLAAGITTLEGPRGGRHPAADLAARLPGLAEPTLRPA